MNRDLKPVTKILAAGFIAGGMKKAYNYPGFFSHELFAQLGEHSIQLSEKHTFAEAFGSSLAGKRTVVTFKNVGLNVAADAYLHSVIAGVNAGLVLVIFDDIDVWGSQESQDSRHFLDFYGGLLLEPSNLQDAYSFARHSFRMSEEYNVPVVIRITNAHLNIKDKEIDTITSDTSDRKKIVKGMKSSFIVHPYYWHDQYKALQLKNQQIVNSAEFTVAVQKPKNKELVIVFGAADNLISKLPSASTNYDVIRVYQLPIHSSLLKTIIYKSYESVYILEYGQSYLWEKISANLLVPTHSIVPSIMDNAKQFKPWNLDGNLFEAIQKLKESDEIFVVSDITRSTVEKHQVVDAALSYGSALSVSCGFAKAKLENEKVICIAGDGSATHEGLDTINYAHRNNLQLTLIIVDNGGLWCTGGQAAALNIHEYLKQHFLPFKHIDINHDKTQHIASVIQSSLKNIGFSIILAKTDMGTLRNE